LLEKSIGVTCIVNETLPPVDEEGNLHLIPEEIIETRVKQLRSREIKEYLVKWKDFPIEDATWESEQNIARNGSGLLEGKQFPVGETVISPSH
jgi:hypothetical protein